MFTALEVADEASLATCLSSNETAACVLTVPSLSWKRDSVSVKGIKTLYSALGMSTIDLGGYGTVLRIDPFSDACSGVLTWIAWTLTLGSQDLWLLENVAMTR